MKTKKLVCYNCGGHGFITATYENGQTSAICPVCGGIGSHEIQMTNADRIRAMSDEELAEVLSLLTKNDVCVNTSAVFCTGCPFDAFCSDCKEGNELEWLQQPAEEDDHE